MTLLRVLFKRVQALFTRPGTRLDEELETHLEMQSAEFRRAGLSVDEANCAARRALGNPTRIREDYQESRSLPMFEKLLQDLRYAFRSARQSPGFTAVCILTLGLGIGSASGVFTLVEGIVLKPLNYRQPGQILFVQEVVPGLAHLYPTVPVNFMHFGFWRSHARTLESMAAFRSDSLILTGAGTPELLDAVMTTGDLFTVLGARPALGRLLTADDDRPAAAVAVITDSLWQRRFSRDPEIIGRVVTLDAAPRTIVGVLPPDFRFPSRGDLGPLNGIGRRPELYLPLRYHDSGWDGDYDFPVLARLRPGVNPSNATAELNVFEKQIQDQYRLDPGLHISAIPLQDKIGGPVRNGLIVLLAAVSLLLLIVCVNFANLQLARSMARSREFSIRAALGASQSRLVQQVLVESILLSAAGGLLGIFAAVVAVKVFVARATVHLPRLDELSIDIPVLAFACGLTLLCGAAVGLLPAFRFARAVPQQGLRAGSHTTTGGPGNLRLRDWLVGSEVAISTILLMLAGLLMGSLWNVLHVDKGFTVDNAIAVRYLPQATTMSDTERTTFLEKTLDALRGIPGVKSAAFIAGLPLTGESQVNGVAVDGAENFMADPANKSPIMVNVRFTSPGYFETMGIPLVRGSVISPADHSRRVAVISERLAAKLWPGRDPVGRKLRTGSRVGEVQVAGVVRDVHNARLDQDPTLLIYVPYWLRAQNSGDIVIRTALRTSALMPEVQRRLWSLDRSMPIPPPRTVAQLIAEDTAPRRLQMQLSTAFAVSALILAALGIYGVVSYSAARRRKEIGIRIALGARTGEVRRLMIAGGLRPVAFGLVIGLAAALASGRLIRNLLYQVSPADPLTVVGVAASLMLIAAAACAVPARNAARLDPAKVLRDE